MLDDSVSKQRPKWQNGETIKVFAHLAHDKDLQAWQQRLSEGRLVGKNDVTPYGYGRAESMGCKVEFSRAYPEKKFQRVARLGIRVGLGYDLLHALNQIDRVREADVVWTHTESQFLAMASVLSRLGISRPKLIGQAVWLFDRWDGLLGVHKALFQRLIERVDVLTTLSPENATKASSIFPKKRVEVIRFAIPVEGAVPPRERAANPMRVVAVGNDRHRDWASLVAAVTSMPNAELRILSGTAKRALGLSSDIEQVHVGPARSNDELYEAYSWATVAVVPLLPNLHASGITAVEEAVLAGVSVIVTDTGGLRHYFSDGEVKYVRGGEPDALRQALAWIANNGELSRKMAERAQMKMIEGGLRLENYIEQHVQLSRELLTAVE